jgi:hypothetical protein
MPPGGDVAVALVAGCATILPVGAVVMAAGIALLGVSTLRMRVVATASSLVFNRGFRTREAWGAIESFRLQKKADGNGPQIYALLSDGEMIRLPLPLGGLLSGKRRLRELHEVRAQLEHARLVASA